jgi:hypothetical protein
MLYRIVELPSEEPIQYAGVYVLKWGRSGEPTVGFVEATEFQDALNALKQYRQNNALNFQLEKLDDYLRALDCAIEKP